MSLELDKGPTMHALHALATFAASLALLFAAYCAVRIFLTLRALSARACAALAGVRA